MNIYLPLFTLLCAVTSCMGLPDGAPLSVCSSLLPHHKNNRPQQGNSPYSVFVDKIGENKVRVTISSTTGEKFRGFILQARSATDRSKFIAGVFTNSEVSKGIDCHNQKQSTLTHVNSEPKSQVTTEWTATAVNEDVIFRATIAETFETYWENIDSELVKIRTDGTVVSADGSNIHSIYDSCFESKGCLGLPHESCVDKRDCEILFTHEKSPAGDILFALHGVLELSEYMAMGLSNDSKMGDDFVSECFLVGPNEVKFRNSWNEGRSNTLTTEASGEYEFTIMDKQTTCVWTQSNITNFNGRIYDLVNDQYYILLAKGPVSNGKLHYHTSRLASGKPVDFFASNVATESVKIYDDTDGYGGKQTAIPTEKKETVVPNSCSQLNSSLFWLALFGFFFASGKNVLRSLI